MNVWWRLNVITSQWKCGGAWMLSLHSGSVVVLECYHFTMEVWWCWNVGTSLWICSDAGMLSLHNGCVLTLECYHFTVMCDDAGMLALHSGSVVVFECYHFTVDVWWRWNVGTSLWMCGGAPTCSANTLNPEHFYCPNTNSDWKMAARIQVSSWNVLGNKWFKH